MTKIKYETCIIMARSFINEFITTHEIKKKKHPELVELNEKLKKVIMKFGSSQKEIFKKAEQCSEFTFKKFEKFLEDENKKEIEANNLAFGLGFVFLLIEHDMFKSLSDKMFYKRVSNNIFNICEKESNKTSIHNANMLIHRFDEETE